jgi:hypothetical protein
LFPLFPKEPEKTTGELWTKSPFNWPKHWTSAQASRIAISSSDHHGAVAIVFDLPRAAGVLWIASENFMVTNALYPQQIAILRYTQ